MNKVEHVMGSGHVATPSPVKRQTEGHGENITFLQTTYAFGNNSVA